MCRTTRKIDSFVGCNVNGQLVTADRSVTTTEDPCVTCRCNAAGRLTCAKQACPVLHCPGSKIVHDSGECCPRCKGRRNSLEGAIRAVLWSMLPRTRVIVNRQSKILVTAERRVHAGNGYLQFRQSILPGSVYAVQLLQFHRLLRSRNLSGTRLSGRTSDRCSRSLLSPVFRGRGGPTILHLRRQNLRGEYLFRSRSTGMVVRSIRCSSFIQRDLVQRFIKGSVLS